MDKFSVVDKNKEKFVKEQENPSLFKGKKLEIINYQDHEVLIEKDTVAILPYFKEDGYILMRHEYNMSYQYRLKDISNFKGTTNFLTCITGSVEDNESIIQAVRRELYEEAGIVLSEFFPLQIEKKLFKTKSSSSTYYPFILELNNNEYKSTSIVGDGSKDEDNSRTIKIDLMSINEIETFDLITEYLLLKLKNDYKL